MIACSLAATLKEGTNHIYYECKKTYRVYLSANCFPMTWHGKAEFELRVSFFVYPPHGKKGIRTSIFIFCFLTTLKAKSELYFRFFVFLLRWKRNWNFCFVFLFFCLFATTLNWLNWNWEIFWAPNGSRTYDLPDTGLENASSLFTLYPSHQSIYDNYCNI